MGFALFRRKKPSPVSPVAGAAPPGMRLYAIGDVHGRDDLLNDLLGRVREDARNLPQESERVAVFLGDYVDRGHHSKAVIDILSGDPLPGFKTVFLKGNHEQAMIDFLDAPTDNVQWMEIGGAATVLSYGVRVAKDVPVADRCGHIARLLKEALPPEHKAFLRDLKLATVLGDYVFAHTAIDPDGDIESLRHQDMFHPSENRTIKASSSSSSNRIVVHGHMADNSPVNESKRICIDTGAYATGTLTCVVLEGDKRRFLSTRAH